MQILIKTLAGTNQQFNFEPTDKILQVKQTLQESVGVDVAMIKLIWKGTQLADDQTIANYKIAAGDCIHMVMQLR